MDEPIWHKRFWAKVQKTTDGSCWLWTAFRRTSGYGKFHTKDIPDMQTAHRFSYLLAYGEFDRSLLVLHKCDNPPCVNPDHLFLGTPDDNMQDAVKKDRFPRGVKRKGAILNWDDVFFLRHLYWAERKTRRELGKFFGVSSVTAENIAKHKKWRGSPN